MADEGRVIGIAHLGIAQPQAEKLRFVLSEVLGIACTGSEKVPSEGVEVVFFKPGGSAPTLEVVVPLGEDTAVKRFLDKRGPGLHHLALEVNDLKAISDKVKAAGLTLLYDEPQQGAHGSLIQFIHPRDTGGVLIELWQREC